MDYELNKNLHEKALTLYNEGNRKITFLYQDGTKQIKRIGKTYGEQIIIMANRSHKRGYYLTNELNNNPNNEVKDILKIETRVSKKDKWEKQTKKIIQMLKTSCLWEDNLKEYELALDIGYDKLMKCKEIQNGKYVEGYTENQNEIVKRIKEVEPRLVYVSKEGNECYNTGILWYKIGIPNIKKMRFTTGDNEYYLNQINQAMKDKKELLLSGRTNYDISFEYQPNGNRAWYSEEFKGCGNGHYYLALNDTHAVHYEDD